GGRGAAVFSCMTDLQQTVRPSSLCGVPRPARPVGPGWCSAARSRGEITTHSYTTVYTLFGDGVNTNSTVTADGPGGQRTLSQKTDCIIVPHRGGGASFSRGIRGDTGRDGGCYS